jgi:hypothetical protein
MLLVEVMRAEADDCLKFIGDGRFVNVDKDAVKFIVNPDSVTYTEYRGWCATLPGGDWQYPQLANSDETATEPAQSDEDVLDNWTRQSQ